MAQSKKRVVVLYSYVGHDEFEGLRTIDPGTLDFTPEYPIHVATIKEEYDAIVEALQSEGFDACVFNLEDDLKRLERILNEDRPDLIFNLVESFRGNPLLESPLAGLFELHGIPFTGASPFALALCLRKGLTKKILLQDRIPTPRFTLLSSAQVPRRHGLRYPLIIKPARQDASLGVRPESVVRDYAQLAVRTKELLEEFPAPLLVEEFIEGRELHVSVWGNEPPEVLPIIEYDFSQLPEDHPQIITYDVKWNPLDRAYHSVHSRCPAELSKPIARKVAEVALRAYIETRCRDYARVDIRLAKNNRPYVLEVNPNPDLTAGVSFMESAEKAGYPFQKAIRRIAEMALDRD